MTLSTNFELANNSEFRLLSNFSTPPRPGRITALEGNGQVRVTTDDPDGGDVLAWPLNGFQYAVNDVVYLAFALNNPDSAIVIGSKAPLPKLDAGVLPKPYVPVDGTAPLTADWDIGEDRRIQTEALRARDNEGLQLEDDGGNLGVFIADGGNVAIGPVTPITKLHIYHPSGEGTILSRSGQNNSFAGLLLRDYLDVNAVSIQYGNPSAPAFAHELAIATRQSAIPMIFYQGGVASGNRRLIFDTAGNAYIPNGLLGIGMASGAQGKVHVHDGAGGFLFVTKTNIVNAAQTIIPNAAGDVTAVITGFFVVMTSGGASVANAFTLYPGNSFDITAGGYTMRIALNANGQLTTIRQSGSGSATLAIAAIWI